MLALTHVPSPRMDLGQRTHIERVPIEAGIAERQHSDYCRMLGRLGVDVVTLDVNRDLPDSVFIEDTAIVLDEVAVLTTMGVAARRAELAGIEPVLQKYRTVQRVEGPATLEGGDVLQVGRTLLVGVSSRTNIDGVRALEALVCRYDYQVTPVAVHGCLHLKTACTALPDQCLLVNPAWLDTSALGRFELIPVPDSEPWAANTLSINRTVCAAAEHQRTTDLIRARGFEVETVSLSQFLKAEGGLTCLSLLFNGSTPC
jgi:dimethylargininase